MTTTAATRGARFGRALIAGALAVGTLDGLDGVLFYWLWRGVDPARIFQSVASGLLGPAAFAGGLPTVLLGVVLHYVIAGIIVLVYLLASRRMAVLHRRRVAAGVLYGVAVYLVMNHVVVPLSAAATAARPWPVVVNGLLIHMVGVGLPAALAARWAAGPPRSRHASPR